MNTELEIISPDWVGDQLLDLGVVSSLSGVHLQPLPRNPERLDYLTRQAFRLWSGRKTVCFLLIGAGLENIWRRARAFSRACPNIATKPLFLQRTIRADFLGLEFVDGGTLEEAVFDGRLSLPESGNAALAVFSALESTFRDSTASAAHAELKQFFASVLSCPIFGNIDGGFLRDVIFPWVRAGAIGRPARTRWTNGDLVAQNIIFDEQGNPRLVDYEFAQRTHFFSEDVLRWRRYSQVHKDIFDQKLPSTAPWLEAFFLLRQTVLESQIANPQLSIDGAKERVWRLRELASEAHSQFRASLFLKPLAQSRLDESEAERARLAGALSAQQTRIQELDAEVVKRGEWGLGLEANLTAAIRRAAELQALVEERTKWAQNLDLEIAQLRTAVEIARADRDQFAKKIADADPAIAAQQAHIQELDAEVVRRGEWALGLEANLKAANGRAAELQALVEERTKSEQNLDLEIAQLRAAVETARAERDQFARRIADADTAIAAQQTHIQELDAEVVKRGEWGLGLEANLTAANGRAVELQALVEERTKWAQNLDQGIAIIRQKLAGSETTAVSLRQEFACASEDLKNREDQLANAQESVLRLMKEIENMTNSHEAVCANLRRDAEERELREQTLSREAIRQNAITDALLQELVDVKRQRDAAVQEAANLAASLERASAHAFEVERCRTTTEASLAEKTREAARAAEDLVQSEEQLTHAQALMVQSIDEMETLRNRKVWLEDKVQRMQSSCSWKSTAALRAARRLFFGK
jgi:hypothetical protein